MEYMGSIIVERGYSCKLLKEKIHLAQVIKAGKESIWIKTNS